MGDTQVKTCSKCKEAKPLDEFYFIKARGGYYSPRCISCSIEDLRLRRRKHGMKPQHRQTPDQKERGVKTCSKCLQEKKLEDFRFRKDQGKHVSICRECEHARQREYDATHREQHKTYMLDYNKKYYWDNKPELVEKKRAWQKENAERIKEKRRIYEKENREMIQARHRKYLRVYDKKRKANDPLYKFAVQTRNLISGSFTRRGYTKRSHCYEILGCDWQTFYDHLMKTWKDNYGTEWNGEPCHIDHIIPLATAKTEQDIIDLCYYENLQLLKPEDNLLKNDSLEWELPKGGDGE